MVLAAATSLVLLALAGGCAHRLWHAQRVWQALAFLPAIVATWAISLFVREPTNGGALLTFLTGDIALFGLSVLGVMRMLGGLPPDDDGGPWGDDGDGGVDPDDGSGPRDPGRTAGRDPRHGVRDGVRRRRDRAVRRPRRARATSSSDRSARSTS